MYFLADEKKKKQTKKMHILHRCTMTLSDVAEVEEVSATELTHYADSAGTSPYFFLVGIVVGFILIKNSRLPCKVLPTGTLKKKSLFTWPWI